MSRKMILSVLAVIFIVGCSPTERYSYRINLPRDIYTLDADPNDHAYSGLVHMSKAWEGSFGLSERSLKLYNDAVKRDQIKKLQEEIKIIKTKLKTLKDHEHEKLNQD